MKSDQKARAKRGQNEGSIYKGADGRWRAIVPAKYSANGRRKMIVGSQREGNTREAVARKLAESLAGTPGASIVASRETVETFLRRWLIAVASRVKPKTLESYAGTCNSHIIPAIGGVKLQALQPHHVSAMMARVKGDGYAMRSVAYSRSVLRIALTDAKRWGIVTRNVADREYVDPPRVPKTEIEPLDMEAAGKLLRKIAGTPSEAIITTVLSLGLRIGEALGLRWKDVDFKAKTIRIARAYQRQGKEHAFVEVKSDRSRRALLLSDSLIGLLKEHRRKQKEHRLAAGALWENNELVFATRTGRPIGPRNVLRSLHRALEKAEIPRKRLHDLRHTAATLLLAQGVPLDVVSDILGHSSIRVTADTYAHFVLARQEGAAGVMGALLDTGSSK